MSLFLTSSLLRLPRRCSPSRRRARIVPLKVPQLPIDVVAPAPDASVASGVPPCVPWTSSLPAPDPIPSNKRVPSLQAAVVEPPPSLDEIKRRSGQMNMSAPPPLLSLKSPPVQRASGSGNATSQTSGQSQPPVAPAPSAQGLGSGRGSGQIIALSLNPTDVRGPIEIPEGNQA